MKKYLLTESELIKTISKVIKEQNDGDGKAMYNKLLDIHHTDDRFGNLKELYPDPTLLAKILAHGVENGMGWEQLSGKAKGSGVNLLPLSFMKLIVDTFKK